MSAPICTDPRKGKAYRDSEGHVTCALCDYSMEWVECNGCNGDGFVECYEDDPLWYDEDDTAPCTQCGGSGGDYWCEKQDCPTCIALEILPQKP